MNPILQMMNANPNGNQQSPFNIPITKEFITEFDKFLKANKDKTPQQIAKENGIDMNALFK